jgi:hypothetical protein
MRGAYAAAGSVTCDCTKENPAGHAFSPFSEIRRRFAKNYNSIKAQLGWHLAQRFKRHGIMFYFRRNASHAQIALVNIYFSLTQNRPRNFNFLRRIYKLLRALSRLLSLPPSLKRNDHFPETVGFVN